MMAGRRSARWRERWVQQETERRTIAYEASLARWRRRDVELREQLAAAAGTQPAREGDYGWLQLAPDETVYWSASDVGLVEGAYVLRLRPPHYRELGRADEPAAGPPIDTGQLAVTDRRVVYIGRMVREWTYPKLIGMAHTAAGETWLLATTGQKVTGVAPLQADVAAFRLHLALALADSAGEREALVAELAEQVEQHRQAEPEQPAPVTPDQAPPPGQHSRPRRRLLTAAAAGSAVLVSLVAIGAALGGGQRSDDFSAPPTPSPAAPSPPAVTTPEDQAAGAAPHREPVRVAVPPQRQPPPPPPTTAAPATPSTSPSPTEDDPLDPWFRNCDEANEHGYGPYFRDQDPEYWWYRDRNDDGVVCRP